MDNSLTACADTTPSGVSDAPQTNNSTPESAGPNPWITVSKPNASVIIQERKLSDAFQKAIQESIDKGKKAHRAG